MNIIRCNACGHEENTACSKRIHVWITLEDYGAITDQYSGTFHFCDARCFSNWVYGHVLPKADLAKTTTELFGETVAHLAAVETKVKNANTPP